MQRYKMFVIMLRIHETTTIYQKVSVNYALLYTSYVQIFVMPPLRVQHCTTIWKKTFQINNSLHYLESLRSTNIANEGQKRYYKRTQIWIYATNFCLSKLARVTVPKMLRFALLAAVGKWKHTYVLAQKIIYKIM